MSVETTTSTTPDPEQLTEALARFEAAQAGVLALLGRSGAKPEAAAAPSESEPEKEGSEQSADDEDGAAVWRQYRSKNRRR